MRIPTYRVAVVRARSLTPRMRRVTLGGPALAGLESSGLPDERIKLLLPQDGQRRPALPVIDEQGFHYPAGVRRAIMRSFTLRRFDLEALELDVDFVVHGGVAADWSLRAREGDEVAIAGPAGGYEPGADAHRYLLAGDESALPAIATILERLPEPTRADVLVEIDDASGELALDARADVRITWLHRDNGHAAGAQLAERYARSNGRSRPFTSGRRARRCRCVRSAATCVTTSACPGSATKSSATGANG